MGFTTNPGSPASAYGRTFGPVPKVTSWPTLASTSLIFRLALIYIVFTNFISITLVVDFYLGHAHLPVLVKRGFNKVVDAVGSEYFAAATDLARTDRYDAIRYVVLGMALICYGIVIGYLLDDLRRRQDWDITVEDPDEKEKLAFEDECWGLTAESWKPSWYFKKDLWKGPDEKEKPAVNDECLGLTDELLDPSLFFKEGMWKAPSDCYWREEDFQV